jgi:PilZ domain-containing protein
MTERRRAIRYPLKLPASFSWEDEGGLMHEGGGHTRNVSEKGAFVDAAVLPPIGSSVELHFSLPSVPHAERKMHVQFMGEIIRLEWTKQGEQSSGFAIRGCEIVWNFEGGNKWSLSAEDEEE